MNTSIRITEAEWEVMTVVWERAPVPASVVVDVLEHRKQWTLATVRTLLRRLVN
ncbi:MAG: Penicillinase repressor, partial [Verrucomicrobiales bacterium]|nr:Penicillinase repressor [Verrucomicrobiales bacterium]